MDGRPAGRRGAEPPAPVRARRRRRSAWPPCSPRAAATSRRRPDGSATPPTSPSCPTSEVNDVVLPAHAHVARALDRRRVRRRSPTSTGSTRTSPRCSTGSATITSPPPPRFAELTTAAGGEPYECPNSWLMERTLQPVLDHIVGATVDDVEIPPTDDADRDALATADALETIAAATAQQYVERLADPALACRGHRRRHGGEPAGGDGGAARQPAARRLRVAGADRRRGGRRRRGGVHRRSSPSPPGSDSSRPSRWRSAPPTTSASASASTSRRRPRTPTSTRARPARLTVASGRAA